MFVYLSQTTGPVFFCVILHFQIRKKKTSKTKTKVSSPLRITILVNFLIKNILMSQVFNKNTSLIGKLCLNIR